MASNPPPPTYEDERTQLLICPAPGAVQFQKGYLGAHGERAAIEGELQIKGAQPSQWDTALISLTTTETYLQESIEISNTSLVLFSRTANSSTTVSTSIPSTLPFSIPLTPDIPQCLHTPHSSISHTLVATLVPSDTTRQPLAQAIRVHTRRYTAPGRPVLLASPYSIQREDPAPVKVELPRTTFRIGEPIPVYITIPPPELAIVRDRGLQLRNVKAELVRTIAFGNLQERRTPGPSTIVEPSGASTSTASDEKAGAQSQPESQSLSSDYALRTVVTRTGSSCRFHKNRPVRIRLLVYPHSSARQMDEMLQQDPEGIDNQDTDCASITQSTLIHHVSFRLSLEVTFMSAASHSEIVSNYDIPLLLLPNAAPQPEVDEGITAAYRKKHDKPPERTVRHEDGDMPDYNVAGPSEIVQSGAPPPFEERDAPPPFFPSDPSTSRLPTFLEAESDISGRFPMYNEEPPENPPAIPSTHYVSIPGEGIEFGFTPEEQYDGMSSSMDGSPGGAPPSIIDSTQDTDVTQFANLISQPDHSFEALALTLEPTSSLDESDHPPPPPPPLDDPSDPPPSIDVEEFRRPVRLDHSPQQRPIQDLGSMSAGSDNPDPHAPPPYLQQSDSHSDSEESVMNPPPYVDLMPAQDPA